MSHVSKRTFELTGRSSQNSELVNIMPQEPIRMLFVLMMILMMIEAQNCEAKSRVYEVCSAKTEQKKYFQI
jgi:hypothetical protein